MKNDKDNKMPVKVIKVKNGYDIIEKRTGKKKGHSKTKKKAEISSSIRNKIYKKEKSDGY